MKFIDTMRAHHKWLSEANHKITEMKVIIEFQNRAEMNKLAWSIGREFHDLNPYTADGPVPVYLGTVFGIPFELKLKDSYSRPTGVEEDL